MAESRKSIDPLISVVNYDVTSSEDGLSDIEPAEGQAFVYASSKLPAISCLDDQWPSSSESDHEAEEFEPFGQPIAHTELPSKSPSALKIEAHSVVHVLDDSEDEQRGADVDLASPAKRLKSSDTDQARGNREEITLSSEDEDADNPASAIPTTSTPTTTTSTTAARETRKPYALKIDRLPTDLRAFLADTRSFFTRTNSLERLAPCVSLSTYSKAEERILCFLGFAQQSFPETPLKPATFGQALLIENYLDYLQETRLLSPATISNHASSLLYPLKYIHRQQAPTFSGVPIIAQLRRAATLLQKQGDLDRPQTREELQALNRWLDWDEVLEALSLQRSRFEVARTKHHRAREAADLLLLSLYCHIPPSRGLEIRTLEVVRETELAENFTAGDFRDRNVALLQRSGAVAIHVQLYKTRRFSGHEQIELEAGSDLCRLLRQFVEEFRAELCCPERTKGSHLFLNANGEPFSSGAFSRHLKGLMVRLTGRAVSVNGLRSAFLTWAYSQRGCTDQMKDSLAAALRHSREQAQSTYDRRTANDKKALAVDLARSRAEEVTEAAAATEEEQGGAQDQDSPFSPGDFVGLVERESTLRQPRVLLGRVHSLLPGGQASLLWYKDAGGGVFSLELDGTRWVESMLSLVAASVKPAKGKPNGYRLCTSLRTLHKAVHGARQP